MGSKELQKKAHEKLTGKTDERSPEHVELDRRLAEVVGAKPVAGWESREVDTVEVEERRASLGVCAVRYRCDTGEEIGIRELRADELQSTIPGS